MPTNSASRDTVDNAQPGLVAVPSAPDPVAPVAFIETSATSDLLTEARRALHAGDTHGALRATDAILRTPDGSDVVEAATLAAIAYTRLGMSSRALTLYQFIGADRIGTAATDAVLTAIGLGDVTTANAMLDVARQSAPTSSGGGLTLLATGIYETVTATADTAIATLDHAVSWLAPLNDDALHVDSPAAIAAITAMHGGEFLTATSLLTRAHAANLGGPSEVTRHETLLAWVSMLTGDIAQAEHLTSRTTTDRTTDARNAMFAEGLRVGIARRQGGAGDISALWQRVRHSADLNTIDLYYLLPLGEFLVAAATLADHQLVDRLCTRISEFLEALGHPLVWETPLRWYAVQAFAALNDLDAVSDQVSRLQRFSQESRYATVLAAAGEAWLDCLKHDVVADKVIKAAQQLAQSGHRWEAAHLCSIAASRAASREEKRALVMCARDIRHSHDLAVQDSPMATDPRVTSRQRDVAELIKHGLTYREIGAKLFISPRTVEHHVTRLKRRLGVHSRRELLEALNADDTGYLL